VGQPEFGYTGRTILSVYFDRLWKSYLFNFDDCRELISRP
jgi:hypothetical protein